MQIKAILFDLDGVILDSEKVYFEFWKKAAERLNYNLPPEGILQLRSCDSSIAKEVVRKYTQNDNAYGEIRQLRKELMNQWLESNTYEIKPGVKEFLDSISNLSLKKVIVTSSLPETKLQILKSYGVADCFDEIISVKNVERNKPYPDIYRYACKVLNLSPDECMALEDSPNGVNSAFYAGVKVIMIPDLSCPDEDLQSKCKVAKNMIDVKSFLY